VLLTLSVALVACRPSGSLIVPTNRPSGSLPTVTALLPPPATIVRPSTSPLATATQGSVTPRTLPDLGQVLGQPLIEGVDGTLGIESMNGERLYGRNTEESFAPASMIKIPIALVVLKILEFRGDTLEDIRNYGISRNFSDMLEAMVVRSEETATESL